LAETKNKQEITPDKKTESVAEKETTNKQFQDWTYQCSGVGLKDEQCFIMQNIFTQESGKRLLRVVVGYLEPDDSLRLFLTTPLDIYLPAGIVFNIVRMGKGGEEYKIPIHVCMPGGCRAFIPLDKNLIWAMKKGSQAKVAFVDNNTLVDNITRKEITVEFSLAGFTRGLEALGTKRK
jgi:invasion protein IalB